MLKIAAAAGATLPALLLLLVPSASSSSPTPDVAGAPTAQARRDISPDYLRWYMDAAHTCPGLSWAILAAIGKTESDHGRSTEPGVRSGENHAGAGGPMQFLAATFTSYATDGDNDGRTDRYNPADAIHTAAHYLCANHAGQGGTHLRAALYAYNHSSAYVTGVLALAATYAAPTATIRGQTAVRAALHWLGTPYSWGGGNTSGPTRGIAQGANTIGFDCSALTQYAWAQAGIHLDRIAADQYRDGPHIPRNQIAPGDLLFFAHDTTNPATIHHVALYLGNGRMIHAPQTGDVVRTTTFTGNPYREHQYIGATRPSPQTRT
ncbi:NlpC/P60 family protein [Actinomadura oligospora]|uniref:C40 family peptidase n=1 Tax=Actinomadura oligospora TaxID=111804 RepID=UPI00047CCD1F|nr:lytic transglycosylase domain-containing protein [Actinomadura oligospora]